MIAIAPMLDCTDKHFRMLFRFISRRALLYTEMMTANAILHGDRKYLLHFNLKEHPVSLQLGGCEPAKLALAAKIGEEFGYQEINLNIGCPSDRVQAGRFGACLMKEPALVADCVASMKAAVNVPVTVKCRLGVDKQDDYESLYHFVETIAKAGCLRFIVHARKAWLKGLSPKQNRTIPPLRYEFVYQLKKDFPKLTIFINGGIQSVAQAKQQLNKVDGVMIGRQAYQKPYSLIGIDAEIFGDSRIPPTQFEVIEQYLDYIHQQITTGVPVRAMTRHLLNLLTDFSGAKALRSQISHLKVLPTTLFRDGVAFG